jgi:hypothetical protein
MLLQWPKKDELGGACTRVGEMKNAQSKLVGKGEGKIRIRTGRRIIIKLIIDKLGSSKVQ